MLNASLKVYIFILIFYNIYPVSVFEFFDELEVALYLQKYGYLDDSLNYDDLTLTDAIKNFQNNYNMWPTGEMNHIINLHMTRPRCGVWDPILRKNDQSNKGFLIKGPKWDKTQLTWRLNSTKPNQVQQLIRQDLKDAFEVWETNTVFTFQEEYGDKSDILVEFFRLEHGDGGPFDGPGKSLAHAFYPDSGEVHFDDDETWNFGRDIERNRRGSNFFDVAVHQIGHTLGLGHSMKNKVLMFPIMAHDKRYLKLTEDEISGIEAIYGSEPIIPQNINVQVSTTPKIKDTGSEIPDQCYTGYDAISNYKGQIFIFKDKYVWRVTPKYGVMDGYPVLIRRLWQSLPSDLIKVDAVYEYQDGRIMIFVGKKFYKFAGNHLMQIGLLTDLGISEVVTNIKAIFNWGRTNETFIFSDDVYWKFNETAQRVHDGYPQKTTRVWKNVHPFDLAFQKNGITYFFKGLEYFEFDDKFLKQSQEPKNSSHFWMQCPILDNDDLIANKTIIAPNE